MSGTNPVATLVSVVVGMFTKNLGVKIAALVMAVVVWFTVRQDITREVTLPVQIRGLSSLALEPHGLMPVGTHETGVKVTFSGPASEIEKIRQEDQARILLRVSKSDLLGESRRVLEFSLANRNVEHPYGDNVEILSMEPASVRLTAAEKGRRKIPVRRPTFDASLDEWKVKDDIIDYTTEINVSGPKDVLDTLTEVTTKPIPVGELLRGNGEEIQRTLSGDLDIADELEKELVRAERGERITYEATFVRSRVPEGITLPFFVKYENLDTTVRLAIETNDTVLKTADGLTIDLKFTGRPADLQRIREGADEGEIRAFIRAEDYEAFVQEKVGEGGTFPGSVRLEMPDDLRRVTLTQPDRGTITVSIETR